MRWKAPTSLRVTRSSSPCDRDLGSTATPPLAPPKGTSKTAHFQVMSDARPRISSMDAPGSRRQPPL